MIDTQQSDWDEQAQLFLMGYRALPHDTTGISPCMLMLGRQIGLPEDLEYGIPFHEQVQLCSGDYAKQLRARLQELHEITIETVRDLRSRQNSATISRLNPPISSPGMR